MAGDRHAPTTRTCAAPAPRSCTSWRPTTSTTPTTLDRVDRENLTAPRWLLTLESVSHVPPYTRVGNAHFELLIDITIDFLDGTLKGHPERLDRIKAEVDANASLADLER